MRRVSLPCLGVLAGLLVPSFAQAATSFTASAITSPANGAELFYDGDTSTGSITVQGTVTPALTTTGTLLCYSAPETWVLATGVPITSGAFDADVSLAPVADQVCRLELIPTGSAAPTGSAMAAFSGPVISVSYQSTLSSNGNPYGYTINAGNPDWSFTFDSLGGYLSLSGARITQTGCPITASDSTDPTNYGSYSLFFGNACLLELSGIPPDADTRSAIQIDSLNAYPPGSIPLLAAKGGYQPLSYTASWDATHDTTTITETDVLMICAAPGGFPPTASNCPSLIPSGVEVQQTSTLLPGGQVARVSQTFTDTDNTAHNVDLLFSQSINAYASGEVPGFEFPEQSEFATHAYPDSYSPFPSGPGTIYVIADAAAAPAVSNPIGAITYNQAPHEADFTSLPGAQTATFLMHYVESLPAGGSFTLQWSFAQATSAASLGSLVRLEVDRFETPTLTLTAPAEGVTTRAPTVLVSGQASDPEGIASVSVAGHSATVTSSGAFTAEVPLGLGLNTIQVTATNLAGVTATAQRIVVYAPRPCVVPKLSGRTLARARALLANSGCLPGKVVRVHSRRIRRGKIVATTPRAGTRRIHGTAVRITVSLGAPRSRKR